MKAEEQLKETGVRLFRMGEPDIDTIEEFFEKELPEGEAVDLAFSTEKAHIFCAETGELIR